MKLKDSTVGILIIGVILMFIVPLPSSLLDVLLTINITASVIILLNTIYSKGALDMSKSHQHEAQNVHSASVCSKVKIAISFYLSQACQRESTSISSFPSRRLWFRER